jgi:hypothetical protein
MADEPERPPTYEELLAQVGQLKAYALGLEDTVRGLQASVAARDVEIQRLTLKVGKKPARLLDPKAASAFDRPWNGR